MVDDPRLVKCYTKLDRVLISLVRLLQMDSEPYSYDQLALMAERGCMSPETLQNASEKLNVSLSREERKAITIEVLTFQQRLLENEISRILREKEMIREIYLQMQIDTNIKSDFTKLFFENTGIQLE